MAYFIRNCTQFKFAFTFAFLASRRIFLLFFIVVTYLLSFKKFLEEFSVAQGMGIGKNFMGDDNSGMKKYIGNIHRYIIPTSLPNQ